MMALSTFFIGLSIKSNSEWDKWLKRLMLIHGGFFVGCVIMPMTGVFVSMASEKPVTEVRLRFFSGVPTSFQSAYWHISTSEKQNDNTHIALGKQGVQEKLAKNKKPRPVTRPRTIIC